MNGPQTKYSLTSNTKLNRKVTQKSPKLNKQDQQNAQLATKSLENL